MNPSTEMPREIGRYEVLKKIGRGGMATVYLARDPMINRQVAIKLLPARLSHDHEFQTRFRNEAEVVAQLEHPFIVPIYDYGYHNENQPYIVMRYLSNGTLKERMTAQGPLEISTVNAILGRLCAALDEAHDAGVVHRDLKPSNVLFDHRDKAFLTDFGIAKLLAGHTGLTSGIVGTPAYMSPEQAQGMLTLDGRSDVYALGILVFEMLSGKQPFDAETPMGVALRHITDAPPDIRDFKADIPAAIAQVIARALEKPPASRFPTTTELARAFTAAAKGQSTSAPATRPRSELDPTAERQRALPPITQATLTEHKGAVLGVAINPEGTSVASASSDRRVILWQPHTKIRQRNLDGHTGSVRAVAFSPNGALLATASEDRTARIWEARSGRQMQQLQHSTGISALAFNPNGTTLACAGDNGRVYLWHVDSGQRQLALTSHRDWVRGLAFSPDGEMLATASSDHTVRLWQMPSGEARHTIISTGGTMWTVAFLGQKLLTGNHAGQIQLWDTATGQELHTLAGPRTGVWSMLVLPDQDTIITAGFDAVVRRWSLRHNRPPAQYMGHSRWVRSLALFPDAKAFASGSDDATVRLWPVDGT